VTAEFCTVTSLEYYSLLCSCSDIRHHVAR